MKVAILGYGKMGQNIEKIANKRGHSIVLKTNTKPDQDELKKADVAIDFSEPNAAFDNISLAILVQVPVISGTTGWLDDYDKAVELCREKSGRFLYASNFSVGVNLFFKLNSYFSKLMSSVESYKPELEETHHIHKKDAPSGTAISLAEQITKETTYESWACPPDDSQKNIPIKAYREGEVFGDHSVTFSSEIDQLSIKHSAKSRQGFALGAVMAAEWLSKQKPGVYQMAQVLDDLIK